MINTKGKYILFKHILLGVCLFYFVLHPLTMIIYWFEFNHASVTLAKLIEIAGSRVQHSFMLHMMPMSGVFILFGAIAGLGSGLYYKTILRKNEILRKQEKQLEKNIITIIEEGEGPRTEFKSSCRYDYKNKVVNKELEKVIIKSIAGFLNSTGGGTLLIGIDDNGKVLGLEKDYLTLKKKDRDGFEQHIFQLIVNYIGMDFCSLIYASFYQLNRKDICRIDIDSAPMSAYVKTDNKTNFYLRAGNTTRKLTVQEAVSYINLKKEDKLIKTKK